MPSPTMSTYIIHFGDEHYLQQEYNFSFTSQTDYERVAKHCSEEISDKTARFRSAAVPTLNSLRRELRNIGHHDAALAHSLQTSIAHIRSALYRANEIMEDLEVIVEACGVPELLRDHFHMRGDQGGYAWTFLFWFWACWRKYCHTVIDNEAFITTMRVYNGRQPRTSTQRRQWFLMFGDLCDHISQRRHMDSPGNLAEGFRESNRDAYNWHRRVKLAWIDYVSGLATPPRPNRDDGW